MNNDLHTIFSGSGCPSHQQLKDYFENKLSGKEKHLIEEHLIDCEMCTDELEGISFMKDPEKLDAIIEGINSNLNTHDTRIIPLKLIYRLAGVAAVSILVIGTYFILQYLSDPQQDSMIAGKTEPIEEKAAKKGKGRVVADPIEVIEEEQVEEEGEPPAMELIMEPIVATDKHGEEVIEEILLPEMGGIAGAGAEIALYEEDNDDAEPVPAVEEYALQNLAKSSRGAKSAKSAPLESVFDKNVINIAYQKFDSGKYRSASNILKELVTSNPDDDKANYHLAYCYYELNKVKKTLEILKKILSNPQNDYYSEARSLLEKIVDDRGKYSSEALELLNLIKSQ